MVIPQTGSGGVPAPATDQGAYATDQLPFQKKHQSKKSSLFSDHYLALIEIKTKGTGG